MQCHLQTATYGSSVATFTLTQIATNLLGSPQVTVTVPSPILGTTISGSAGSTASIPAVVSVLATNGTGVPNVGVLLVSISGPATASCAATAGAGPGTVLTDVNGNGNCMVILGGASGTGQFQVVIDFLVLLLAAFAGAEELAVELVILQVLGLLLGGPVQLQPGAGLNRMVVHLL